MFYPNLLLIWQSESKSDIIKIMDSLSCFLHNVKTYVCNIRLELQMEIEQRNVVSYLHRKRMKRCAVVVELAAVDHEDAIDENRVKYWRREIGLNCSDLSNRPNSGRPLLEDIDARILQVLEAEPWSSVRH
jgi:hypothetical protein